MSRRGCKKNDTAPSSRTSKAKDVYRCNTEIDNAVLEDKVCG